MNLSEYLVNTSEANFTLFFDVINSSTTMRPTSTTIANHEKPSSSFRYTFATLQLCILILAVLGNFTLIFLICFHRKLCTTTNIFIANLAVVDILLALAVIPFDVDRLLRGYFAYNAAVCEMSSTAFFLSLPASAINLLIMTFERFCAVRFPLQHRTGNMFTKRRIIAILMCSWVYITIIALLPVMGWRPFPTQVFAGECMFFFEKEYAIFLLIANFVLPLLLIVVMNIWILRIARYSLVQRSENHAKMSKKLLSRSLSVGSSVSTNSDRNKTTRIIAMLVGVFAVCWLPYIINTSVNIICNGCSPYEVSLAAMTLVFMNSAINPLLYGIYKPQIRNTLKDALTRAGRKLPSRRTEGNLTPEKDVEETCF